jgi:protein-S-isoprenylcysteine O-methyltransferase Ste14
VQLRIDKRIGRRRAGACRDEGGDMRRTLDYPPVWLAAGLVVAWLARGDWGGAAGTVAVWAGTLIALAGALLFVLAVPEFLRAGTTVVPHAAPRALITRGIYRFSRNPIYLGDLLILTGLGLRWHAAPTPVLASAFVAVITLRFIRPEEARLRAAFGAAFDDYAARTRRWV